MIREQVGVVGWLLTAGTESRGHVAFGDPKSGPCSQEPLGWPTPNVGDPA